MLMTKIDTSLSFYKLGKLYGHDPSTLRRRVHVNGMSIEDACLLPSKPHNITCNEQYQYERQMLKYWAYKRNKWLIRKWGA